MSEDEAVCSDGIFFPVGLCGLEEAELRAPIVRLLFPADHPEEQPPFSLPGRARWEILREGSPTSAEEATSYSYTFVFWSNAPSYLRWLEVLRGWKTVLSDVVVILHAAEDVVPNHLAGTAILKADHGGRLYETLFHLLCAMVLPAVFQSAIGADPVDIVRLAREGGRLCIQSFEADDDEKLWREVEQGWAIRSVPDGELRGFIFAIMAPIGMPVLTSSCLLDGERWERLSGTGVVDFVVTLFSRDDEKVSATLSKLFQ